MQILQSGTVHALYSVY